MQKILFLIWVVDSLVKVFPSTLPPQSTVSTLEITCAGNEWESAQLAFRSETPVEKLVVKASSLQHAGGNHTISPENILCQFIGFIPIDKNSPNTAKEELICYAPAQVPDVLLEDEWISVPANSTQPIWITVYVPKNTPAGRYQGEILVEADGERQAVPLELTVFGFNLPNERHFYMTNWFDTRRIAQAHQIEFLSDAYFEILQAYAQNMAEHRQNVFMVSPWLVRIDRDRNGNFRYDFTNFDRFVQIFLDAGVRDRIEISHIARHGEGGWNSKEILLRDVSAYDHASEKNLQLPPEEGLGPLLSALQDHIQEKGWLKKSVIHISDEPAEHNVKPWREASEFVSRYAPKIKRIDAIETTDIDGLLEVWVPKLNHLRNLYPLFKRRQDQGIELWYYICLHPTGVWMNRFLDYPLIKVRLLHWLNYRYGLDGYLHWGLNFWRDDPFGTPDKDLPPGDTHTIYPGARGPLNSIRWEAQRDSAEDFEYLWLLQDYQKQIAERLGVTPADWSPEQRSAEICRRIVQSFTEFEREPERLRQLRSQIANEIESALQEPLVLLQTYPAEDVVLFPAPITIALLGATQPGATVKVDGREIQVKPDGTFQTQVGGGGKERIVSVEIEYQSQKKQLKRYFQVDTH